MGSRALLKTTEDYYILGLWLADGYWWSSSFGISSSDRELIRRFKIFLKRKTPDHEIKTRTYKPAVNQKRKKTAWHVYVNSRKLARFFLSFKKQKRLIIQQPFLNAYLAGRIDGDGSIDYKYRSGIRIAYSDKEDAKRDAAILGKKNISLYHYKQAGTWVIYLKKNFRDKLIPTIQQFSVKLLPRRD